MVAWSPAVVDRLQAWQNAERIETIAQEGGPGQLFRVRRKHRYTLKGTIQSVHADVGRIVLSGVVPEQGQVVLSLHYQTGMRVSPGRIQLEQEPNSPDEIPFVRLLLDDPASRVTITWEKR